MTFQCTFKLAFFSMNLKVLSFTFLPMFGQRVGGRPISQSENGDINHFGIKQSKVERARGTLFMFRIFTFKMIKPIMMTKTAFIASMNFDESKVMIVIFQQKPPLQQSKLNRKIFLL